MTPNQIIFSILYIYLFSVRLLHWTSILQQKEYRLDRLIAFFRSPAGQKQLISVINLAYSKNTLKRPKLTPKIILIICLTYTTTLLPLISPFNYLTLFFYYSIALLLLPLSIFIASLPFSALTLYIARRYQSQAKALIQKHKPLIIGITGSYGKTTTKILLAQILKSQHQVWASPKSFNTPLSLPQSFVQTYKGQKILIIEYAAYKKGEIKQLTKIFPPNKAIITGITYQHLATFKSLLHIIQAKSELPYALKPGSDLIYNDQDKSVIDLVRPFKHLKLHSLSQLKLTQVKLNNHGQLSFSFNSKVNTTTQLTGQHYISNLKLAIITASLFQVAPSHIKASLERFKPSAEFIRSLPLQSQGLLIIDDKTSNPKGFEAIINLASHINAHPKIIVSSGIIDLGNQSDIIHQRLGEQSNQIFDLFIHTSPLESLPLQTALKNKYLRTTNAKRIKYLLTNLPKSHKLIVIEGLIPSDIQSVLLKQ